VEAHSTSPPVVELVDRCSTISLQHTDTSVDFSSYWLLFFGVDSYCGFCVFLVLNLIPCSCKCFVRKVEGNGGGHLALEKTATLLSPRSNTTEDHIRAGISPFRGFEIVDFMYDANMPSSPLTFISRISAVSTVKETRTVEAQTS
jgi:hypothetical protein